MAKQLPLFALPARTKRVLMHVIDAGDHGCVTDFRYFVHLRCRQCGHDAGWSEHHTKRETHSQPCPRCNVLPGGAS